MVRLCVCVSVRVRFELFSITFTQPHVSDLQFRFKKFAKNFACFFLLKIAPSD